MNTLTPTKAEGLGIGAVVLVALLSTMPAVRQSFRYFYLKDEIQHKGNRLRMLEHETSFAQNEQTQQATSPQQTASLVPEIAALADKFGVDIHDLPAPRSIFHEGATLYLQPFSFRGPPSSALEVCRAIEHEQKVGSFATLSMKRVRLTRPTRHVLQTEGLIYLFQTPKT